MSRSLLEQLKHFLRSGEVLLGQLSDGGSSLAELSTAINASLNDGADSVAELASSIDDAVHVGGASVAGYALNISNNSDDLLEMQRRLATNGGGALASKNHDVIATAAGIGNSAFITLNNAQARIRMLHISAQVAAVDDQWRIEILGTEIIRFYIGSEDLILPMGAFGIQAKAIKLVRISGANEITAIVQYEDMADDSADYLYDQP